MSSLLEEANDNVQSNLVILSVGVVLLFVYVAGILGRCNLIQQRILLSVMGMVAVGMSILASYGTCFFMGIFFAELHPIIPFLLMGIGVDDMFVIVNALDNLPEEDQELPAHQRVALAMKHAGASITVTSVTDMFSFLIGATTVSLVKTM